jgi:hypothetical protein
MDDNELQYLKASASIRDSLDPDSNVTLDRLLHFPKRFPLIPQQSPKHFPLRTPTLDGRHMDDNESHPLKAPYPICDSSDPASNATDTKSGQLPKQFTHKPFTLAGMHVNSNELFSGTLPPIALNKSLK